MKRTNDRIEDAPRTLNIHTLTSTPSTFGSMQMGSAGNISQVSTVVQEQYCMCRPRTKLERRLVLVVAALGLLVVGLLIGLVLALARHSPDVDCKDVIAATHLKLFSV
ncbi:uncharacterized protein LOC126249550 [Schistocerca nitens]|uniref:uncharacterized protein LOC126249550 n=1 Tax=Schistocerca nitens TaxID=7011 RepID=UPI0021188ABB|nr:uncharacterized protein LOC126249550 [Schistocerca nitens]